MTRAQSADQAELETILVTGSRIVRDDLQSASPVVRVDSSLFARTNAASVETVLSRLPQFVPTYSSVSNNPSNGGQGNLNLRGLGSTATLVLLDGRRVVPSNGDGVVDVNIIPGSLVESVDVFTGGASAVYGSDAIAGVVNFKLKDEFDGLQFDGSWNQTARGDGTEYSAGLTAGFNSANGRSKAYGYAGYTRRDAVLQSSRSFSEVALGYVPELHGFLPEGSPIIPEGVQLAFDPGEWPSQAALDALFFNYGYAPGSVPFYDQFGGFVNPVGFNADGSLFTIGSGAPGSVANFRGERDPRTFNDRNYTFNFAPFNYLQLPFERATMFGRATFEATPAIELYAQAIYVDYSAATQVAPTPAFLLYVPVGNPTIPADLRLLLDSREDAAADVILFKRLGELGPRLSSDQHEVWQGTLGARGGFATIDWQWDAYVQFGRFSLTETQQGNALRSKVMELTRAEDGGRASCDGGLDLFGPESISEDCAHYIATGGTNLSGYDQTIAEFSSQGPIGSLPAGQVQLAVGVLYKSDDFFYRADPTASVVLDDGFEDIQGFNASASVEGADHNLDLYAEALLPLLRNARAAARLDAVVGFRHSDYALAGGEDAYKAELLYTPVPGPLLLRGSYQRAVRAPSVFELYLPQLPVAYFDDPVEGFLDPCSAGSAERLGNFAREVETLCLAQGVPAAILPLFTDVDGLHPGVYGGNPDLGAEKADTLTLGFTMRSSSTEPLWSGLQVSMDWYRIEMRNAIVDTSAMDYVPRCFDARANPGFDPNYAACRYFTRDLAGQIQQLADLKRNISGREVSGIDLQVDWNFSVGPGEFTADGQVSWMDTYDVRAVPELPPVEEVGFVGSRVGGSLPEWKWNLNLMYTWQRLSTTLQWRYIGSMHDRAAPERPIDAANYLDVYAVYEFASARFAGLTLRAGIENLSDAAPPMLASSLGANTDPAQYDVLGRRFLLSITLGR